MSEITVGLIDKIIESGIGDVGRLEHIKNSLIKGNLLYNSDIEFVKKLSENVNSDDHTTDTSIPTTIDSKRDLIRYAEDEQINEVSINRISPKLQEGEELLWTYNITKGFFRKTVTTQLRITNYRIMRLDVENNSVDSILMQELDDVVVINSHRVSESVGYSVHAGRIGGKSIGLGGVRFGSGTSKTIGDVVFIVNGKKITWQGLPDPQGLRTYIKAIKKHLYDELDKLEKAQSKLKPKSSSGTDCINCGKNNLKRAKFCNGCGKELLIKCINCEKENSSDSSFCNYCGYTLQ